MLKVILYIDPGIGSMVVQMAVAGFLGGLMFFKRISNFVKRKLGKKVEEEEDSNDE